MQKQRLEIGTFTLTEPTTYRRNYETASWYTDIEVQPGEYQVTSDGYWYFIRLPGKVTGSLFINRLFTASSASVDKNVGKDEVYTSQGNLYLLENLDGFTPSEGFEGQHVEHQVPRGFFECTACGHKSESFKWDGGYSMKLRANTQRCPECGHDTGKSWSQMYDSDQHTHLLEAKTFWRLVYTPTGEELGQSTFGSIRRAAAA